MLDGDSFGIGGIHIAGVCGFGGGFDALMLNAWGEPLIKAFVQEAIDHAVRLEKALSRADTERKVVITHYAPIRATVLGEPPEISPFLGSTRLEGPINRQLVKLALHGHAHHGAPEGRTSAGIPVYNVAIPVLEKLNPGEPPMRVFEV
jgi:Icc-related predicted phosphoesterase